MPWNLHKFNIPVAICCFILGLGLSFFDAVSGGILMALSAILHLTSSSAEDPIKVMVSKFSIFAVWAGSIILLVLYIFMKESFILKLLLAVIAASSIYTAFLFLVFTGGKE